MAASNGESAESNSMRDVIGTGIFTIVGIAIGAGLHWYLSESKYASVTVHSSVVSQSITDELLSTTRFQVCNVYWRIPIEIFRGKNPNGNNRKEFEASGSFGKKIPADSCVIVDVKDGQKMVGVNFDKKYDLTFKYRIVTDE